jgi:PHS family inorganic phosphate transporter-like MFS transporter
MNAYEEAYEIAKLQAIITACSTVPGYWFTVYFIDPVGRFKIQMMGFLLMAIVYLAIGIAYSMKWKGSTNVGFMILYGLTFFFSNFGPNTTTFIVPAELFSARFRSTCHGISGAVGLQGRWGQLLVRLGFCGFHIVKRRMVIPKQSE